MKTYKININNADYDYLYMSNEDPCKFICDLKKCGSIKVVEVNREGVKSINEIANIYQSIGRLNDS